MTPVILYTEGGADCASVVVNVRGAFAKEEGRGELKGGANSGIADGFEEIVSNKVPPAAREEGVNAVGEEGVGRRAANYRQGWVGS